MSEISFSCGLKLMLLLLGMNYSFSVHSMRSVFVRNNGVDNFHFEILVIENLSEDVLLRSFCPMSIS